MNARPLARHLEQRVWGRHDLPEWVGAHQGISGPIGEIWYVEDHKTASELLVKYLFTSDRLSIQVHPDDEAARALGRPRGKDEAWLVLDAEPNAVIGLGLNKALSREELRAAALDGSIELLIDWRPVQAGDFFYSPAGTIHAIGAGLSLIEIQQNLDLTYRLYDFGRPRELHLEAGVNVAIPGPWSTPVAASDVPSDRTIMSAGGAFVVERWTFAGETQLEAPDGQLVLIPLRANGALNGCTLEPGSVWRVEGRASLTSEGPLDLLAAYPGGAVREHLLTHGT